MLAPLLTSLHTAEPSRRSFATITGTGASGDVGFLPPSPLLHSCPLWVTLHGACCPSGTGLALSCAQAALLGASGTPKNHPF